MTVAELIRQLKKCNPTMRVVIHGYEDGYHMVYGLEILSVVNDPKVPWYSGDYQKPYDEEATEVVLEIVGKKSPNWQGGDK